MYDEVIALNEIIILVVFQVNILKLVVALIFGLQPPGGIVYCAVTERICEEYIT